MNEFKHHKGIAAPIIRNNIDTDAIIPSVEMKRVSKQGLSEGLFAAWRYSDRLARVANPEFILNQESYAGTSILLSGKNFGCGSSREHAVWALDEFGIRVILAPSFGAIFYSNCIANGLLPINCPAEVTTQLAVFVGQDPQQNQLMVDLESRKVSGPPGATFRFEMADSDAEILLNGWDPVTLTLQFDSEIESFRRKDRKLRPWIYL